MKICLFGHPYTSLGMGELLASFSGVLDFCQIEHKVFDIYGKNKKTPGCARPWLQEKEIDTPCYGDVRIFHINGDEVAPCLQSLAQQGLNFSSGAKNIIVPAWELPHYPQLWRESINRFDEIWAFSQFIENIFSGWTKARVRYLGHSAERKNGVHYPRKYFGIKDSSLVFLSFFDQSSYLARKNPLAVIELYRRLRELHPFSDFQLLLKGKNMHASSTMEVEQIDENILFLNENLNYDEMTSLIDSSDVFVSLHRAEGFGRGGAEAVLRGKRAIVTNYSGVEDYSSDPAVLPVGYTLVPVQDGEYPHHSGQVWAEPDIGDAVKHASRLIEEHEQGLTNTHFFQNERDAGLIAQQRVSAFSVALQAMKNLYIDE